MDRNEIYIKWHVNDILDVAQREFNRTMSIADARLVLEELENSHDANTGINWDVIKITIDEMLYDNKITLTDKKGKSEEDFIAMEWHVEDVQGVAKDQFGKTVSIEDARRVLQTVKKRFDANIGINWEVLEYHIKDLSDKGKITLIELDEVA